MTETSELYRTMRQEAAEKRRSNREKSTAILRENGIPFEEHNGGAHLIIRTKSGPVNFWPSTGLYNGAIYGRGVFNLMEGLKMTERKA